jgi:hypothetical protein
MAQHHISVPADWEPETSASYGPFLLEKVWRLPDGSHVHWSSRLARKRQLFHRLDPRGKRTAIRGSNEKKLREQRRLNLIAALAFVFGGSLFAIGAAIAQLGSADVARNAVYVYFAGGLFFNTGGYVSLLQVVNAPRELSSSMRSEKQVRFRWWSFEPQRIDWLSAFVLFCGTIVFGINLLDSFLDNLTARQENILVWAPDMIGCALFLISGHLALAEACNGRFRALPNELGWWIALLNQVGSYLFLISGVAAFIDPRTSDAISTGIANWGTLFGALCFAIGGVVQLYEKPEATPSPSLSLAES